jgi:hypothetical protein
MFPQKARYCNQKLENTVLMKNKLNSILWDLFAFVLSATRLAFSSRTCKQFLENARSNPYDLIIVPGLQLVNGRWDPIMKARINWAKYVLSNGIAKNVMFSGAAVHTPYYEARIMALYAKAVGIPEENIFEELLAEHSTENVFYSYKYARKLGFCRIALASDPFQTKMLRKFVQKKIDPDIGLLPIVFDILRKMKDEMPDPEIEQEQAFANDFVAIRERMGFRRRFKGTRGFDINPEVYS